eukprot:scaffold29532_cov146-Skeletonema_marinoi.AAC.1
MAADQEEISNDGILKRIMIAGTSSVTVVQDNTALWPTPLFHRPIHASIVVAICMVSVELSGASYRQAATTSAKVLSQRKDENTWMKNTI